MKTIVSDVRLISENELNHYPTFSFSLAEELEREREKRVWVNDTAHRRSHDELMITEECYAN